MFTVALVQPHKNGLTVLACGMIAVEYRYTSQVTEGLRLDRS